MRKLTPKQEKYCQEYVKTSSKTEAYKHSYSTSNMKSETIHNKAYILSEKGDIRARVKELKEELQKKNLYTLEKSVKRDIALIERYEAALDVLENDESTGINVTTAERTIRYIGAQGYNSAQERLSKQHGFFEKDNSQKKIPERVIVDISDYKGEK